MSTLSQQMSTFYTWHDRMWIRCERVWTQLEVKQSMPLLEFSVGEFLVTNYISKKGS